ncbi:hypothetical protein PNEG_02790 [Pneumocystis murina B123]|uniref:DNA polymerase V n=1 Tax=Pneumocystis murina (strain B123) TaxID=1069680 RepID=M7NPJ1_PNEMU|nr:hypothetical protein PNEG_02790 [Pneumocystis murina B123]EMR09016.1 hypothetical protein PNEG_02790 [Pneumocystis murina B123]
MSELNYYWDLASEDPELRAQASIKLIESVRLSIPKDQEKKNIEKSENFLENVLGEKGLYAITRLVKGLSSSRNHSRLGFSTALSEFLLEFEDIDVEDVVKLIEKYNVEKRNHSTQEERDFLFGKLFGIKAILLSKILQRTKSVEKIEKVIDVLIGLSLKKGWLREPCFFVINDILVQLKDFPQYEEVCSITLKKICDLKMSKTPEGVGIILTIHKFKDLKSIGDTQWSPLNPLDSSNLEILAKVLKNDSIDSETKQNGNWNAKLHFVWNIIIEMYTLEANNAVNSSFLEFWTKVIDESFFSAASSLEKKFLGFQVFNIALSKIENSDITHLFSKNFMRCFINHLSDENRYLNKISNKVISCIISTANTRKKVILPIIQSLLGPLGALNFDKITKTKLVESLISLADETSLWDILQLLKTITCSPCSKNEDIDQKRQISIDIMLSILRNKKCNKSNEWIINYITFFVTYGYFEPKSEDFKHPFSTNTKTILRSRLSSSLAHLNSRNHSIEYSKNLQKHFFWSSFIIELIISLSESEKYNLSVNMDSKTLKIKNKSIKIFKKILIKKSNPEKKITQELLAFELLYSLSILQLFNEDPEASSVLEELKICYNNFFKKETKLSENTIEILTDILLGFLSKHSILFRKLVEQTFRYLSDKINHKCLLLLINVLQADENSEKNTLFEEITSDEDYNIIDNSSKSLNNGDKTDAEENFNNISLGISNEDVENDSEESIDDEKMLELHKHIGNMLKKRKKKSKNKNVDLRENIINFKRKVLDILNIFLELRNEDPIILDLILPLLTLIRTTSSDIISNRARNLIGNKLCKAKINLNEIKIEHAFDILKKIHEDALKIKKKNIGIPHSQSSIFLVRIIIFKDINYTDQILKIYSSTFNTWITKKKIKLQASLFTDLINWGAQFRQK